MAIMQQMQKKAKEKNDVLKYAKKTVWCEG